MRRWVDRIWTNPPSGRFEGLYGRKLRGWAFDPKQPEDRLAVELVGDNGSRRMVRADQFRADLKDAGIGDGFAAFLVPADNFAGSHLVRAFVGGHELEGSPVSIDALSDQGLIEGMIEGVVGARLQGWAFDPRAPATRLTIHVETDRGDAFSVRADTPRADLRQAGHGDGRSGFAVPLWKLIGARTVHLYAGDIRRELAGSPVSLGSLSSADVVEAQIERVGPTHITGWAFNPLRPHEHVLIEAMIGSEKVTQHAHIYRADLARQGAGDCHVGFRIPIPRGLPAGVVQVFAGGRELRMPVSGAVPTDLAFEEVRLHVDPADAEACISGWIVNVTDPAWRPTLALRRDGAIVGTERATRWRDDVPGEAGDELHGFRFEVQDDGVGATFELVEADTDRILARLSTWP